MIKIKKFNFENIIVLLFSVLPILDSLNGYLIQEGKPSIGTMYKLVIMIVLFFMALYHRKFTYNALIMIVTTIGYIVLTISINLLLFEGTLLTIDFAVKLIFNVLILIFLLQNVRYQSINGKTFYKILDNSANLMIISFLVPYAFGQGYQIYAGGLGYKGFYYSQNELNAVLIILFYFCLYKVVSNLKLMTLIQLFGLAACILLTNTKSSMIACMLGFVVLFIEYMRKKEWKHKVIVVLVLIVGIIGSKEFLDVQIQSVLTRQNSLYSMYGNSLLDTLTSGRLYYLEAAWKSLIKSPFFLVQVIIGNGFSSEYLIEMDLMDIFFYFGLIGITATLAFIGHVLTKSEENFRSDKSIIRKFAFLLMIAFLSLTGHVLFMATSGCYFVLMCCFNMTYKTGNIGGKDEKIY